MRAAQSLDFRLRGSDGPRLVIPAKAGIQMRAAQSLDSRLRGSDDGYYVRLISSTLTSCRFIVPRPMAAHLGM
jgi:hypothetical protein